MEPWAAHLLIGYQGRYDVVTVAGSMALCLPKNRLPKTAEPTRHHVRSDRESTRRARCRSPRRRKASARSTASSRSTGTSAQGKLWMEVSRFDQEFLYQIALATGLGSNPVGLDRGQLGDSRVVMFRRVGPKVLLVEPNYKYRAVTDRAAERRAVDESFAQSVHWGFKVEAEEAGKVLVDATAFFLRDAHGVAERLRQAKQGRLPPRRRPQRTRGRAAQGVPEEHRSRGDLDVRRRRRDRPARRRDGPVARCGDRPPAAFARRAARAEFGIHARGAPTPASASSPSTSTISPRPSPSRSSGSSSRGTA